jgi:hypothetical protein
MFLFLAWLLSSRMSTLKFHNILIGQSFGDCTIIFWTFLTIKIEYEWALYTNTICITFHVLIQNNCYNVF